MSGRLDELGDLLIGQLEGEPKELAEKVLAGWKEVCGGQEHRIHRLEGELSEKYHKAEESPSD